MTEPLEWDYPATMRPRRGRRKPPPPLEGEVLGPEEPSPRVHRVEIEVRHHRRPQQLPPLVIAPLIFAVLRWISPLGLVVALFMAGILLTAHPTIAIALGIFVAALIIIALRERRAGRPF